MAVEAPRAFNIDYHLGHVLWEIFTNVDGSMKLDKKQRKNFASHITNYLQAINTEGDERLFEKVRESRRKLQELGVSDSIISDSEIIAARVVIENLVEHLAIYQHGEEAK